MTTDEMTADVNLAFEYWGQLRPGLDSWEMSKLICLLASRAEPLARAVRKLLAENEQFRAAQNSCELAVARAVDDVEDAHRQLDKFVELAGGVDVCGEHSAGVGGAEGNDPWANALEVLTSAKTERDQYHAVAILGRRLPAGELSQDPAFVAFMLGAMEKEIKQLKAALKPFAKGHLYADEELRHLPDRDTRPLNPYDPERSPTVGDCRRAAELLNAAPVPGQGVQS